MITIENSNIVDWDNYPRYICAIVMVTNRDVETIAGFIMPAGEELTWLLDKAPLLNSEGITIKDTSIECLGGLGFVGDGVADFIDIIELHYKPKPVVELKKQSEVFA